LSKKTQQNPKNQKAHWVGLFLKKLGFLNPVKGTTDFTLFQVCLEKAIKLMPVSLLLQSKNENYM